VSGVIFYLIGMSVALHEMFSMAVVGQHAGWGRIEHPHWWDMVSQVRNKTQKLHLQDLRGNDIVLMTCIRLRSADKRFAQAWCFKAGLKVKRVNMSVPWYDKRTHGHDGAHARKQHGLTMIFMVSAANPGSSDFPVAISCLSQCPRRTSGSFPTPGSSSKSNGQALCICQSLS